MKTNLRVKLFTLALFTLLFAFQALSGERRAVWIAPETAQGQPNTWLIYRKDVKLDAVPTEMFADIAADTKYWLWINGEPVVFEGGLKRGPAPNSIYFDRVDIAPYLKAGRQHYSCAGVALWQEWFLARRQRLGRSFFEAISPRPRLYPTTAGRAMYTMPMEIPRLRIPTSACPRATYVSMPARSAEAGICPDVKRNSPELSILPMRRIRLLASS